MDKNKNFQNKNSQNKMSAVNIVIISVISFLYVLLITKLAELISVQYISENIHSENIGLASSPDNEHIGVYVMIIYFVSIIGIIIGYIWFGTQTNAKKDLPNWIIRWSLSLGGVLMLIYTIINYWEYLGDYSKLLLIFLSITSIIYYLYKYY